MNHMLCELRKLVNLFYKNLYKEITKYFKMIELLNITVTQENIGCSWFGVCPDCGCRRLLGICEENPSTGPRPDGCGRYHRVSIIINFHKFQLLRATLDKLGLNSVQIVATDGEWDVVQALLTDTDLLDSVDIIG